LAAILRMSRLGMLLLLVLAAIAALALRWPRLDARPMHNDEAVNAIKFGQLWEEGTYKYDPNEHHGPSLLYATLAVGRLFGAPDFVHFSDNRLRAVTVLFGFGLVLLLPLLTDGLGRGGMAWAALLTAVSPAMAFYSRYYIHEILLVCFTLLALGAGWRYWRSRKLGWALLAGCALGLMDATKETFMFTLAAVVMGLWLNHLWSRHLDASAAPTKTPPIKWTHLAAGLGVWLVVAVILFSSFFTNASGPLDSIRTYLPWIQRAGGASPHIHPWYFYLQRLLCFHLYEGPIWTEAFILLLAVIGAAAGFRRRRLAGANASLVRFLAFYTFLLTAIYSALAYKTPWCLLSFWHGMILLAGVGAAVVIRTMRRRAWRVVCTLAVLAGTGHLAWQAWQADTTYAADPRNPYVYSQTTPDILKLVAKVDALASVLPQPDQMLIKVMSPGDDYWPLPWYLRRFKQVGWWDRIPGDPYASVMLVAARFDARLDEKEDKTHIMNGVYHLRPQVDFELYIDLKLWRTYLEKHPPKRDED
jgi:uncharacterized protein (TIGR03663 family)